MCNGVLLLCSLWTKKILRIVLVAIKIVTGVKNHVSINDNHKTLEWVFTLRSKELKIKENYRQPYVQQST